MSYFEFPFFIWNSSLNFCLSLATFWAVKPYQIVPKCYFILSKKQNNDAFEIMLVYMCLLMWFNWIIKG